MIKVKHLDKYFNKNRSTALHVIDDTTLEFPNHGLVTLLGKSGSGKTTLLNVIGGLDKSDSGTIEFFGQKIKKYNANKWDDIRSKDIGYIFQNYYLMPNLTVFENVAFVLKMIGLNDEEEIKSRVNYVLESVGLYKYRKKKALQLSGGQQQRVAIARAIVKNPKVIIADEPTGNLDAKNTVEIMNIIKEISKETLVIWVTHELEIANIYSDRIVSIKDGKVISDNLNQSVEHKGLDLDDTIYLEDLNKLSASTTTDLTAEYYSDSDDILPISVKLIVKNETLYISLSGNDQRVVLLNENSPMKIVNDSYKEKTKSETLQTQFDTKKLSLDGLHLSRKLNFNFKNFMRGLLNKFSTINRRKKLILLSFIFSGFLLSFATALVSKVTIKQNDRDLLASTNLVTTHSYINNAKGEDLLKKYLTEEVKKNKDVYIFDTVSLDVIYEGRITISDQYTEPYEIIDENRIIAGRKPKNDNEIMISKKFESSGSYSVDTVKVQGIWDSKYFLNETVTLKIPGIMSDFHQDVVVTGIVDENKNSVVYMGSNIFLKAALYESSSKNKEKSGSNLISLNGIPDNIRIISGRRPEEINEIVVPTSSDDSSQMKINDYIGNLKIVGIYDNDVLDINSKNTNIITYTKNKSVAMLHNYVLGKKISYKKLYFKTEDNDEFVNFVNEGLEENFIDKIVDLNDQRNKEDRDNTLKIVLPIITVIVLIALIGFYFLNRASVINQVYNISVLRSLGVKKRDVSFKFVLEVLFMITISALPGYLFGTYFITVILESFQAIPFYVTGYSVIIGLLIMYSVFALIGLLPIWQLLRKTPSQISSKYDM